MKSTMNLISNAIKFVREGGKPEIRIYSEERLGCVRIFHQIQEIREVSSG